MAFVQMSTRDGLADIVMNRPKVNALNVGLIEELGAAFQKVAADGAIHGALLRAEGRCFSAGLDLMEVAAFVQEDISKFLDLFDTGILPIFECPKPVAVAVSGHAIAGGLILALCGDFLALGDGDYRVGLTELAVGVPFPRVAFEAVRIALEPKTVRHLIYSAEVIPGRRAFELGVGDIWASEPEHAAWAWLEAVARRPAVTFQIAKRQLREEAWRRCREAPAREREELVAALGSPEVHEALLSTLRPAT
jgi:enoyl-CoA hydratase